MEKFLKASAKAEGLEVTAQNLENRLKVLEASAGRKPEAEVAQLLNQIPSLPEFPDADVRLFVTNARGAALETLVQKLSARLSNLEALEPKNAATISMSGGGENYEKKAFGRADGEANAAKDLIAEKISQADLYIPALEGQAEKMESRLMALEATMGKAPRKEVSQVVGSTPALPASLDPEARIPVLTQKSMALKIAVENLADRISDLEQNTPRSLMADVPQKVAAASNSTLFLEGLAKKLEARMILLEASAGKNPQPEVSQVLGATPKLDANVAMAERVPAINQKSAALESLLQKMTARISSLEASSPGLAPTVSILEASSPGFVSTTAEPAPLAKMSKIGESTNFDGRRSSVSMELCKAEEKLQAVSDETVVLEGLAEKFQARLLILEASSGHVLPLFVPQNLSTSVTFPPNASIEERIKIFGQRSVVLQSLTRTMEARLSLLETSLEDGLPKRRQQNVVARGLVQAQAPVVVSSPNVATTNIDELMQKERRQAAESMSQLQETHGLAVLRLQEEVMKVSSMAAQERQMNEETIKRLEVQVAQARERLALQDQVNKELEAKLAAVATDGRQKSNEHAILQEQTIKELEAQLRAGAAEWQQQREQALLQDQTIKELETKLAAAVEERAQVAVSGEALHMEILAHRQGALEFEERVRELTSQNARLQEDIQKSEAEISYQALQFDGERKDLLNQAEDLKKKVVALEEAQTTSREAVTIDGLTSPVEPLSVSMVEPVSPTRLEASASLSPKAGPSRLVYGPLASNLAVSTRLARVSPPLGGNTPVRPRSVSPTKTTPMLSRSQNNSTSNIYPVKAYAYQGPSSVRLPPTAMISPPAPLRFSYGAKTAGSVGAPVTSPMALASPPVAYPSPQSPVNKQRAPVPITVGEALQAGSARTQSLRAPLLVGATTASQATPYKMMSSDKVGFTAI